MSGPPMVERTTHSIDLHSKCERFVKLGSDRAEWL